MSRESTQQAAQKRQLAVLKLRDQTKRMKLITTMSGTSTSPPKLEADFESRVVRTYLVPRINPVSSTKTADCCSQVAGLNQENGKSSPQIAAHQHHSQSLGLALRVVGCACTSVPGIHPRSSTETPACCSQVAGPNQKNENRHHK